MYKTCGCQLKKKKKRQRVKMEKEKLLGAILTIVLVITGLVMAHGEEDFSRAEEIIKNKISCDELSDDKLEILGEYYMEQMHPGEEHETMDEMMGGEGSESLRVMHINMGKSFYCGEHQAMSRGMMSIMMGREAMPGIYRANTWTGRVFFNWIIAILIVVALILLIVWLIKQIKKKK